MSMQETFHSALADSMADFVAFKRMQGYDYCGQVQRLKQFDVFMAERDGWDQWLRYDMFCDYLATTATLSPSAREGRLAVVREFSKYLHACHPASVVVPARMLPRHCRNIRFYRIEPEQVAQLMDAASMLRRRHAVVPAAVRFLIGLLYCTGLRIAEALALQVGNVDLDRGTLFVRKGKFGKDRLVALTDSALEAVDEWLKVRSTYAATGRSAPLLIGGSNAALTYWQAKYAFKCLCKQCGLNGRPPPRFHDLRHNFACRCIARWRDAGENLQTLLPVLANAMGHVNIFATQIYIHIDAVGLEKASEMFANHVRKLRENKQ